MVGHVTNAPPQKSNVGLRVRYACFTIYVLKKGGENYSRIPSHIFHTQRPFSVLTLLAFGDEKYYICTEIWEEPWLPLFFVTFPLKSGI